MPNYEMVRTYEPDHWVFRTSIFSILLFVCSSSNYEKSMSNYEMVLTYEPDHWVFRTSIFSILLFVCSSSNYEKSMSNYERYVIYLLAKIRLQIQNFNFNELPISTNNTNYE
jgi:hypothetical protein